MTAELVPLTRERVPEASAALAAAFHDDPTTVFLIPREEARPKWLRLIHQASLYHLLPDGEVFTVTGGSVTGVIGLVPPGRYPLPLLRYLRHITGVVLRLPTGGLPLGRAMRGIQAQALIDRLHIKEPHWYVLVLGVHPQSQGQGLGRALLDPALARADRDRLPAYLETSNERNLTFYGRFGFQVVQQVDFPGGGPPIWTLLRPPVG